MSTEHRRSPKRPQKKKSGVASRQLALGVLIATNERGQFVNAALADALKDCGLSERDRSFATALVNGVIRNSAVLDAKINEMSDRPAAKITPLLRLVLQLALFQLEFMPNIPPQAVLNTATELAKLEGHIGLSRFANGLLRNYLRKQQATVDAERTAQSGAEETDSGMQDGRSANDATSLSQPVTTAGRSSASEDAQLTAEEKLANDYSMPLWMVQRWLSNYGPEETKKILDFAARQPEMCLRPCEISITPEGLESMFERQEIRSRRGTLLKSCVIVERRERSPSTLKTRRDRGFHGAANKLPGYDEGLFSVQDEAAAFVSFVLDPKPGEVVIDLCAAPGGKTTHIAELMENQGQVIAVDVSESRLAPLREQRTRLGLTNILIVAQDGRTFEAKTLADRVLVDAPCTGTGVINRRPDLRYKRKQEDIPQLIELQRELLGQAASLVKPGGTLLYATCSIEPEENFDNARWFLDNFEEFEPSDIASYLPEWLLNDCAPTWDGPACKSPIELSRIHTVQLLPSRGDISGFFIAKFQRRSPS